MQPEFAAMHELRSDLPVECVTLTIPCFSGPHWLMVAQLADFTPDVDVMYDFHRRLLQVLQHGAAHRTWLLKTPGHLMTLEALFATYPDAWIVQTHRDPAKTMPSTVSTTAMVQWMRTDHVDVPALAQAVEMAFSYGLNHSVELRTGGPLADRFVDVHFDRLMRDPVQTLSRAYATHGACPPPGARGARPRLPARQAEGQVRHPPLRAGGLGFHRRFAPGRPRTLHRALRRDPRGLAR